MFPFFFVFFFCAWEDFFGKKVEREREKLEGRDRGEEKKATLASKPKDPVSFFSPFPFSLHPLFCSRPSFLVHKKEKLFLGTGKKQTNKKTNYDNNRETLAMHATL